MAGVHLKISRTIFAAFGAYCLVPVHEAITQAAVEGHLQSLKFCSRADACRDENETSNPEGLTAWIAHKA